MLWATDSIFTQPLLLSLDLGLAPAHGALSPSAMLSTLWLGQQPPACASLGVQRSGAEETASL